MEEKKNNAVYTEDDFDDIMTLSFEDGDVDCGILAIYPVGDREYIALYPLVQEAGDEYYIYRYNGEEDDEIDIEEIPEDADDEAEAAEAGFNEYIDRLDVEDLLDEE